MRNCKKQKFSLAFQRIDCWSPLISLFPDTEDSPFANFTPDMDVRWSCERGAAYFQASASRSFSSLRRDSVSSSIKARCVSNLRSCVKVRSSARWAQRLSSATCWKEEEKAAAEFEEEEEETGLTAAPAVEGGMLLPPAAFPPELPCIIIVVVTKRAKGVCGI